MVDGAVTLPMIGIYVREPWAYGNHLYKRQAPFVRVSQEDLKNTDQSMREVLGDWLRERRGIKVSRVLFGRGDWDLLCDKRFHQYRCRPSKLRKEWIMM